MLKATISKSEFSLGDLIGHEELGLELATSTQNWAERSVAGAHSIEISHPAQWLDPEWVMLTTGVHLADSLDDQRQLIAELDEAGVTALGFGLDVVHSKIPAALLEEAGDRGFPIFAVPLRIPFREVIAAVYRATLADEIRAADRLTAMQRFLVDALGEESPRSTVVQRLASLVDSDVAIISRDGETLISTSEVDGEAIASQVAQRRASIVQFDLDESHGIGFAVGPPESHETVWLIVMAQAGERLRPLTKAAAQVTVPLIAAMNRLERNQRSQDTAIRQATLEALLDLNDKQDAAAVSVRAFASGLKLDLGVTALVGIDPTAQTAFDDLVPMISGGLTRSQARGLATVHQGHLVAVVPSVAVDQLLIDRLLGMGPALRIGVGRTVSDAIGVRQSYIDAELAVRAGMAQGGPTRISRYEDLDFVTVLANEVPLERLAPKIEQWLAPLRANPLLHEAVVSYLRHDLDVGRTARALRLHSNSIRYRLSRAEEVLGARLRSAETIVALYIALHGGLTGTAQEGDKSFSAEAQG